MAVLTYNTSTQEQSVLAKLAQIGGQTPAAYFADFIKNALEALRQDLLEAEKLRVRAEIDRALVTNTAFRVDKDPATGLPVVTRL